MVATLPGRTHGLGLFTEPLLVETQLTRENYGAINLWATLIGSLFCFPAGWLLDRFGPRSMLIGVCGALGATVIVMSQSTDLAAATLFTFLLFTRGFGQSALSVVSLSLSGRTAGTRPGLAMGIYACLTSVGFVAAFGILREVIQANPENWRGPWLGIGLGVLAFGLIAGLFARASEPSTRENAIAASGRTLASALGSGTFWVFAISTSFYGLVVAGTSIFNQSLLAERGFNKEVFLTVTILGIPAGLAANLFGGWAATRFRLGPILTIGLTLLAGALASFSSVETIPQVYAYAIVLAAAGGLITVCFFSVWRPAFGTAHLGRIQGAAQFLTVLFSAVGPLVFGAAKDRAGEYAILFPYFAIASIFLAALALITPSPNPARSAE